LVLEEEQKGEEGVSKVWTLERPGAQGQPTLTPEAEDLILRAEAEVERLYELGRFKAAEDLDAQLTDFQDACEAELDEVEAESEDVDHVMGIEDMEGVPFKDWEPYHCVALQDAYTEADFEKRVFGKKHMKTNPGNKTLYVVLGGIAVVGAAYLIYKLLSQKPGVAQQPPAPLPDVAQGGTSEVLGDRSWWPSIVLDV